MSALNRLFGLTAHGTTVRTEIAAGATTFLTMAYIILVNPAILSAAGMPVAGVAAATCLAAGIGCLLMGFVANYPIALAPGMGLNAYFAYTVVQGMGVPWQTALGLVFLSGVAFLLLTLVGVRQLIVRAVPPSLFAAIAAGIGLFIAFIGFQSAGLVAAHPATLVTLGDMRAPTVWLAVIGLGIVAVLEVLKVRGGILVGIVATTVIGWTLHLVPWAPQPYSVAEMTSTAFRLDIPGALGLGGKIIGLALVEILFVFLFVDMFDNVGTLVAVTKKAGLQRPDGSIPRLNRILFADATATVAGSMAGTSTIVSYFESAAGVSAGGRTGLTAVVTGVLFLAAMFVAPWAQAIPAAATAPALILVGAVMMTPLSEIDWKDPAVAIPAFLILIGIPLTFSIASGLGFGVIAYALLRIATQKVRWSDWPLLGLAALFVLRFGYMAAG